MSPYTEADSRPSFRTWLVFVRGGYSDLAAFLASTKFSEPVSGLHGGPGGTTPPVPNSDDRSFHGGENTYAR